MGISQVIIYLSILNSELGISYEMWDAILSNSYRTKAENYYGTLIKNSFPRGNPCPYPTIKLDGLIRKYQDRQNHNHSTKICQRGLETRIRNRTERTRRQIENVRKEQAIKQAFDRK